MPPFSTVGIIAKQGDPEHVYATLHRLHAHLRARQLAVVLDTESANLLGASVGVAETLDAMGARCDLIIVVGGDGTLLHAARNAAPFGVPLLGINLGRLGFLVDMSPDDIESGVDQILVGDFDSDSRSMLSARIIEDAATIHVQTALNDVVIHKRNPARMIEFETYINGVFVNAQRSDGLIVSTPTGSTAYALSGGGPLVDPALDAILLVPICPHDLSNRPLVVPGDDQIEVRVREQDRRHVQVTCDGQTDLRLTAGERVLITRHPDRVRLLHPKGHDHYQILRAKLRWGGYNAMRTASSC